jgi:hypothetical protein
MMSNIYQYWWNVKVSNCSQNRVTNAQDAASHLPASESFNKTDSSTTAPDTAGLKINPMDLRLSLKQQ